MRIWALITDTLREIYARKVIIGIVIIEVVALSITALILFSDGMKDEYRQARLGSTGGVDEYITEEGDELVIHRDDDALLQQFDTTASADTLASVDSARSASLDEGSSIDGDLLIEDKVRGQLGMYAGPTLIATLFLGIFATAGIVPSMMERGTIDLLLSKPIPRWKLLWGRAAGGAVAVGVNLLFFTVALCAIYGQASGVWYPEFIWLTFALAFTTFIVLFTGVIALNVTTDSWVLPMSLAYVHIVILSNFLSVREETIFRWVDTPFVHWLVDGVYYALPQVNNIANMTGTTVHTGSLGDWSPLIQGGLFAVIMIAFATWKFSRKDF